MDEELKRLKKILDENRKLQSVKESYVGWAQDLLKISQQLAALAREMDPVLSLRSSGQRTSREVIKTRVDELYLKMKAGMRVSLKLVMSTYNISKYDAGYIFQKLRSHEHVSEVREGREVLLFHRG